MSGARRLARGYDHRGPTCVEGWRPSSAGSRRVAPASWGRKTGATRHRLLGSLVVFALGLAGGCGGARGAGPNANFGFFDGSDPISVGKAAPVVHWTRSLAPPFSGRYVPVETAVPTLDPSSGMVYMRSSEGTL